MVIDPKELNMKTHAELYPGTDPTCPAILAPIEPGVRPLCDALNALPDTYTLWSCEGHPEMASTPFVTFVAPQEIAFKLSRLIECSPILKFNWTMSAWFREDGSLQYTVRPDDSRLIRKGIVDWWPRMQWSYAEMCVELINFAQLVTHRLWVKPDPQNDDFQILKITKKPIFPNAKPMDKDEEEQLARRAIIYSFSCGLLRMKSVNVSSHTFIFGILGLIFLLTIISQELIHDIWAMVAFMLLTVIYLSIFIALTCVITGARDPEKVLKN
jgi:hypothetical protein